LFCFVCLFV